MNVCRTFGTHNLDHHKGYCLDHLQQGTSTIPGAGRGAFATRALPKGSIIAPAPLVLIPNRYVLEGSVDAKNATSQLLVNYCFGHDNSQILLCPTTHVALINHNSKSPNAKIRWSTPSQNRVDAAVNILALGIEDLETMFDDPNHHELWNTKLVLEVVAIADIGENEEIFLDYGPQWEQALLEHLQRWTPPPDTDYVTAQDMNLRTNRSIAVSDELPYFYSYECRLEPFAHELKNDEEQTEEDGDDYYSNLRVSSENWDKELLMVYGENDHICWYPCQVFAANDDDDATYQARVYSKDPSITEEIRAFRNIPREAIRFVDAPFQSDQHLLSAFRHHIPILDELLPLHWRDDYVVAKSLGLGVERYGLDLSLPEHEGERVLHEVNVRSVKCGVYFAPSNIPNAGFGVYTAVPVIGQGITLGTSIPAIPVFSSMRRSWIGKDYVWNGKVQGVFFETVGAAIHVQTDVVGANDAALTNCHLGLINERPRKPTFHPVLDRCVDPGAGAFSDYSNFGLDSAFALDSGQELFTDYGSHW